MKAALPRKAGHLPVLPDSGMAVCSECGMADYQVRRWDTWHNHMALVMLGTLFLLKQKKADRQQWPMLSFNDLVTALGHLLPRRQLTAEELADIINAALPPSKGQGITRQTVSSGA